MNVTTGDAGNRDNNPSTVQLSAVAIALAIGLGLFYLATRLVLGEAVAGAMVAALGFGYSALAFLTNTDNDDSGLRGALVGMFRPSWRSYSAIALVWLSSAAVASIPLTRGEFTVSVVDELRRPIESAEIWVDFGSGERAVISERGQAKVSYIIPFSSGRARVRVRNAGMTTTVTHLAGPRGRFGPLQVAVWSGNPVLRATHLSFEGMSIEPVLRGQLPPELARRFRNVTMVLPNDVFQTAREFVASYDLSEDEGVQYLEDEVQGAERPRPTRSKYYSESADREFGRVRNVRNVRPISSSAVMDMSDDILGCPTAQPLRPGFRLRVNSANDFYLGTPVRPVGSAAMLLSERAAGAHAESGTYSVLVERALNMDDVSSMLRRATSIGDAEDSTETRRVLRQLVERRAPRGLLKGWARLPRAYDECAAVEYGVAIEFQIPAPKLRLTILENATERPIRIDQIVQVMDQRTGFGRRNASATRVERPSGDAVYYELQPGESIIVPREFTMRSMVPDGDIQAADRSEPRGEAAVFDLLPGPQYAENGPPIPPEQDFASRPRRISIDANRLVFPAGLPPPTSEESLEDRGYGSMGIPSGPENLIGPSVAEVDYVVGGVRMRVRSDTRTRIAMIGDTPSGSCPFVFVSYGNGQPLNRGQIISDQIGPQSQGPDRLFIGRDFESIEIRELERERSHLDSARLLVRSRRGFRAYMALHPLLARRDGRHLVLERGQRAALHFAYRRAPGDGPAILEVDGYYVPLSLAQE